MNVDFTRPSLAVFIVMLIGVGRVAPADDAPGDPAQDFIAPAAESRQSANPPLRLVAGRALPGVRLVLPHVTIEADDFRMEMEQTEMVRFRAGGTGEAAKPKEVKTALATTRGFRVGMKPAGIDFEVRPKAGAPLKLDAVLREIPLGGASVVEYLWREQPYEILDRDLRVIFSHPDASEIGQQREPLVADAAHAPNAVPMPADVPAPPPNNEEAERRAEKIEAARWRTWTSVAGDYRVHAKFVKLINDILTLEKEDGTLIEVDFQRVCAEDQTFVKTAAWNRAARQP